MARIFKRETDAVKLDHKIENLSRSAIHESAHTLAIWLVPQNVDRFTKCEIWMANGVANGATRYREPLSYSRGQLKAKLLEQCAGKAAELLFFNSATCFGQDMTNAYGVADTLLRTHWRWKNAEIEEERWGEMVRERIKQAEATADIFVQSHAHLLKRVAIALRKNKILWQHNLVNLVGSREAAGWQGPEAEEVLEEWQIEEEEEMEDDADGDASDEDQDFDDGELLSGSDQSADETERGETYELRAGGTSFRSLIHDVVNVRLDASLLFHLIEYPSMIHSLSTRVLDQKFEENIQFRNAFFACPLRPDVLVLNRIDFDVKVGQTVVFIGYSGCGKSTVMALLERFYSPLQLFGGIPHEEFIQICMVSLEPILLDYTIRVNINYGNVNRERVTHDQFVRAAEQANVHNFVLGLHKVSGYDTRVGEKGTQLSGAKAKNCIGTDERDDCSSAGRGNLGPLHGK